MTTQLERIPRMAWLLASAALQRGAGAQAEWPEAGYSVLDQRIDKNHLRRYLEVIGAGHLTDHLPVAYLQVLSFPLQLKIMTSKEFPFKVMGLVHIENAIEQLKPVPIDASYVLRCRLGGLQEHSKGSAFTVETTIEISGQVYWRGVATYLHRDLEIRPRKPYLKLVNKAVAVDAEMTQRARIEINTGLGRAYSRVSGDMNPIHMTTLSAWLFGFKRPIVHGMWSVARVADLLQLKNERFSLLTQFQKPIQIPSVIELFDKTVAGTTYFELRGIENETIHMTGSFSPI